jgi:phenylalanyl-tRNA synthetase beta chain
LRTAATGRKTGLVTDARYRFERGVDPQSVLPGLDLATQMIEKIAGGKPSKATVAGKVPDPRKAIVFDLGRVERLGGIKVPTAEIKTILETLGCVLVGDGDTLDVTPPSWRPDIHGSADLVEEVVRIAGIDNIPSTPLPRLFGVARPVLTERQKRARRARRLLAGRGMVEAVTWSFLPRAQAERFSAGGAIVELANPISIDLAAMRPSLVPGLLTAVERNRNRGFADVALFELGQAYRGDRPEDQYLGVAGVRAGTARVQGSGRQWQSPAETVSVFDAKADVVAVLGALGLDAAKAQVTRDAPSWYHPGRSGTLRLGPKTVLAYFGEVHPATLRGLDVEPPVVAFEIFLDALPPEKKKSRAKPELANADLLPVRRDFAFVLDKAVAAGDVIKAALAADKSLISNVSVFDLFEGGALAGEGKKSLAIEVTLQPASQTLTEQEIDAVSQKVIAEVKKVTGGEIRS